MQLLIKIPYLKLKTRPKQLLGSLPLDIKLYQHTPSVVIKRVSCSTECTLSNVIDYGGHHWKGIIICIATEVNLQQKTFGLTNKMYFLNIAQN